MWRVSALAALVCAVFAAVAIGFASAATGAYGYVSEAGAPDAPLRGLYRAGVLGIAAALAFLAVAIRESARRTQLLRSTAPGSPSRWAVVSGLAVVPALVAAVPFAVVSATVSCTPGCPLPPFESASHSDIVHALASIGGFGLAAGAMLLLAVDSMVDSGTAGVDPDATRRRGRSPGPRERQAARLGPASRVGAALLLPLLAATGLAMLVIGRGLLAGLLERAAIVVALAWLGTVAAILATTRSPAGAGAAARSADMRRRT